MFVKIVRGFVETTYECARYSRRPVPISEDAEQVLVDVEMEGAGEKSQTIRIDCRDTDMFVMNNEGRTFETFWRRKA